MANMYNINGLTYNCKENTEWFTRAMFGGRLIQSGIIRVLTGIKGDELFSMIDLENKILQIDGLDCAWNPNKIIKLSEKRASVKTYKINLEQCIDELEQKRLLYQLSPGAQNENLPPELEDATMYLIAIGLSNEIEEMIIGGDVEKNPNEFDGFVKTLMKSTEVTKLPGYTITRENALDVLEEIYAAIPEEVLQAEDRGELYVLGSYATRRKLRIAISDRKNDSLSDEWDIDVADKTNPRIWYNGMEFIPVKGIENDTLIAFAANNAFLLTDLLSDLEEIKMGQFPEPNESKIWIKGRMRLGFAVPFEDEAVIWSDKITEEQARPDNNDLQVIPNSLVFSAAGETKTFNIFTYEGVEPEISCNPDFFTVTKGETETVNGMNVTTVTVTALCNTGNRDPRVGEVDVTLPDSDREATVTLNQRNEDVATVTE